jgi:hypothetical protein
MTSDEMRLQIKDVISEPPRIIIYKKLKADIINKLKY